MGLFGNAFGWPHLIVILAIVLLLFGAPKLPALARSIGQSMKIFKSEIKTDRVEPASDAQPVPHGEPVAGAHTTGPAPSASPQK
jgi:sec-independent protein translocase protein TatA